jgi:hypothetical protein
MQEEAAEELSRGVAAWTDRSRSFVKESLLRGEASRFLAREHVKEVPAAKIAAWMDFAYPDGKVPDEKKSDGKMFRGYDWIDYLRAQPKHSSSSSWGWGKPEEGEAEVDQIRYLDNLVTRHEVLEGYKSQYAFLARHKIKPSALEREIQVLPKEKASGGFFILAPSEHIRAD